MEMHTRFFVLCDLSDNSLRSVAKMKHSLHTRPVGDGCSVGCTSPSQLDFPVILALDHIATPSYQATDQSVPYSMMAYCRIGPVAAAAHSGLGRLSMLVCHNLGSDTQCVVMATALEDTAA